MKKRVLSLLLVVALMASLSVSALAATYSDLDGHWAKDYINKLSDMGYINGFTDGTFKPDTNTTAVQALAMLSRFYTVSDDVKQWIHEDYGDFVARYVDPTLQWAYDEIELCLAAGIISETELKNMRLTSAMEKELLAVLLVRTMQMTELAEEKAGAELTFEDVKDLNENYIGHIAVLVEGKVIEGDKNNKFNPQSFVNRGVLSTMIIRGLDYMKEQSKTLTLKDYQNYSNVSGLITVASSTSVSIRDYTGALRKYAVTSSTAVTDNGKVTTLSASLVGCFATVRVENGIVVSVAIDNTEGVTYAQGLLTSYSASGSGSTIYATNLDTGASTRYTGADAMKVIRKGADSNTNNIVKNDFATMKIKNGAVIELSLDESSYTVSGTIETLTLGSTVNFNITDTTGVVRCYLLDIGKLPTIQRGINTITIERLKVGDEVTVAVKNAVVSTISATSSKSDTLDGTLTTVTTTTNGTTWVVTDADGVIHALSLDSSVSAFQGTKSIDVSTIQVGDSISVEYYGTTIITVTLKSSQTNTATKLTGTVLAVDTTSRTITVLSSSEKLIYVATGNVGSILLATTGRTISLSAIKPGSQILGFGTYSNGTTFVANSLIIESEG